MKRILTAAAIATLTATGAFAYGDETIDANRDAQRQRIEQGRYNGELTRREYRDLKAEQAKIDADIARAKADGRITKREYSKIHDEQIGSYRHIKSESSDGQKSFWRRWLYQTRN
ncbi:MAG: hypothetical protein HOO99_01465 [Hyphomicrobiaceae bacterium]|nr:hypothetical protein [Hyphomicrobiaceae bacterium]